MIDASLLARVDALQLSYALALDRRDMHAWAACFVEDGSYICTSRENEEQGLPLAIMMDDSGARIRDRVNAVTKVWLGTFEDYLTRHFLQRLHCVEREPGVLLVETNFLVTYTSARGQSEILAAGAYRDEIAVGDDELKFQSKTAILDTVTTPRYLVYPI